MDMALYEKVIQIIDANDDMKAKVLPRLGELHTTMAALRTLGKSIESSGIDDAWGEGDVFGAATTRQILGCLHYKRCVKAHVYTYAALYDLLLEQFFLEHPSMKEDLIATTCAVNDAYCMQDSAIAKASLIHLREELDKTFWAAFGVWVDTKSQHAMFKSLINYTKRVEIILEFIEATRISNLKLHIKSGEQLGKIFFGMDRLKYMRLWPRYIADMKSLESKDPGTWIWMQDKISVTKSAVPFTSIGVDHAVEQVNKILKVRGGLVGISNNSIARLRFFLTAPVMAEYSSKFKEQFSLPPGNQIYHHEMSASKCKRFNTNVQKIKSALTRNGNPFAIEGNRLLSIITQAYIPDEYVQEILEIDTNGQALFESYLEERIIKGETSLWAKLKRSNYKLYSSANSVKRIQRRDDVVEIKETNNYHRRLLIISRSNRDIDLKEAIGKHEMTINPRAFFKANGDILACIGKSQAIKALTDLVEADALEQESSTEIEQDVRRVGIIDGMVVLKKITSKPTYVKTILDLAVLYNIKVQLLTKDDDECITVFDTYKEESHKEAERSRRQDGKHRVHYKIQDDTNIKNLTMERLLSHPKTKHELGIYLSKKLIELNTSSSKLVIASAAGVTYSNIDMDIPNNNHEEADTLMIYHAKLATERYPNSSITIHSVDTDVLLLTVGHFKLLSDSTSLMMKSGLVKVKPIVEALGEQKATALPALHAFTGSDTTGRFAGKGKQTWIKLFTNADEKVVNAIHMLAYKSELTESHATRLEKFVCSAYCPASLKIETIPELRWRLYRQNDADGDKLPPTRGALKEHALRAQVQASVWEQSVVPLQTFLDPLEHGYAKNDLGVLYPITTQELPAPKATLELVRCKCKGDCSTWVCPCRRHDLPCTELCLCPSEENICCNDEDCNQHHDDADDSDSDDEI